MVIDASAQATCRQRVGGYLREMFGERLMADEAAGSFGVRVGSAWVTVRVDGPEDCPMVTTRAFVVSGTELSPEFLHHLLAEDRPPIGAYGLDPGDDVFIEHTVPGDGLTPAGLRASVLGVANEADRADDAIVARFGGIRMTDERPRAV